MAEIFRHSETCEVIQESSNRSVEAVVQNFKEHESLLVIINKSVKLPMKWNGKLYEGRAAGMDFISKGPKINKVQIGGRG
jgi:hypothetical protein